MWQFTPPAGKSGAPGERDSRAQPPLGFLPLSANYLNARRPSWTPSLPDQNLYKEYDRDTLFMSSSYTQQRRSRKRRVEDMMSSFSPLEKNPNSPSFNNFNFNTDASGSVNLLRRSSVIGGPSLSENVERPRKRIISADVFAENLGNLPEAHAEPASPEDGSNLRQSLQIDMKGLVGDAVGNMSISPSSRDICLAARRGLFILDLESPLEVPRFLPQGGTWDVADVQWNPHPQRDRFIVSTSSEKLLIWDLLLVGKTSIAHILKSHYRAITDINWHTTECDIVASTGLDSWIYAWDLRRPPDRPIFGFSAFKSGGTQVKWNRRDGNILASSHGNEVLIWDRRRGSIPVCRIVAHDAKIYGIDWSHTVRNELVTCSLGKTIKTWDISEYHCISSADTTTTSSPSSFLINDTQNTQIQPKSVIRTTYPVWRALNLPFGQGILSLPQRGETMLEMYARNDPERPIEVFKGHTDVVKEFVWRKGEHDEFQLITWSKDRTLRFWPIDNETLQKVGHILDSTPHRGRSRLSKTRLQTISYRSPPEHQLATASTSPTLVLSNPIGNRPILAEIRAPLPPQRPALPHAHTAMNIHNIHNAHATASTNPVMKPHIGSAARASVLEIYVPTTDRIGIGGGAQPQLATSSTSLGSSTTGPGLSLPHHAGTVTKPIVVSPPANPNNNASQDKDKERGRGWTMSRGNVGKSVARMDAFTWLSNVKVGGRTTRESSSGADTAGGGGNNRNNSASGPCSRVGSKSRVGSGLDLAGQMQGQSQSQVQEVQKVQEGGGEDKRKGMGEGDSANGEQEEGVGKRESQSQTRGRVMQMQQQQVKQKGSQDEGRRRTSVSRSRISADDKKEAENQPLQDEITSVLTKLTSSKIKLEKHDLAKKRTCTLGLHGPWGERSSVFIRITFTFPREYPHSPHPEGTPTIDLERTPLVSMRNRAFMLKRLKAIRERKRPCLESCLKFLSFGVEEEELEMDPRGRQAYVDGESSDEDIAIVDANEKGGRSKGKGKEVTVSLLRNHKNLAEPRTTQGAFGPNGELICFFRAPPRLVRSVAPSRGTKTAESTQKQSTIHQSTAVADEERLAQQKQEQPAEASQSRVFSAPALLSEAVRRLTLAAVDRSYVPDSRKQKGEDMGRAMTDLLTLSRYRDRQNANFKGTAVVGDGTQRGQAAVSNPITVIQVRRSMLYASNVNWLDGPDKKVAAGYVFEADTLAGMCGKNAQVARECRRYDHERVWKSLEVLLKNVNALGKWVSVDCEKMAKQVFMKIYNDLAKNKDVQMLAMLAVLILQTPYATIAALPPRPALQASYRPSINLLPSSIRSPRTSALDVFTIAQGLNQQPISPALGRLPSSPIAPTLAPSLSSSTSSRGSWTNIFTTGRQFVQDTFNPTLVAQTDLPMQSDRHSISSGSDKLKAPDSPSALGTGHRRRKDSQLALAPVVVASTTNTTTSRSWTDSAPPPPHRNRTSSSGSGVGSGANSGATFSSTGTQMGLAVGGAIKRPPLHLRWTGSGQSGVSAVSGSATSEKQVVVFDPPVNETKSKPVFTDDFVKQLVMHVHVYAELLFRWQMYEKRIWLLKAVNRRNHVKEANKGVHHQVGIVQTCVHCGTPLYDKSLECQACHLPRTMALCAICRLPVKGLSRNCLHCHHITHISCWSTLEVPICPTGCGCLCSGFPYSSQESNLTRPSTRLAFSPPAPTALVLS